MKVGGPQDLFFAVCFPAHTHEQGENLEHIELRLQEFDGWRVGNGRLRGSQYKTKQMEGSGKPYVSLVRHTFNREKAS